MATRCAVVMLGANMPRVVLLTSSIALGCGADPVVLIAIAWADMYFEKRRRQNVIGKMLCFMEAVCLMSELRSNSVLLVEK